MWRDRRAPSAPSVSTWLLIAALHAAVLVLSTARQRLPEPTRAWTELRIVPTRPAPATIQPSPQAPDALPLTRRATAAPALPNPVELDAPAPAPADALPSAGVEPPHDLPPLQLSLASDAATRPPALDDSRGNTPVSRFGARIAHDLGGDGRWVKERMAADFVRLRRGNACVNLHRSGGAARQPFNESTSPTLWGATPAYRCERR